MLYFVKNAIKIFKSRNQVILTFKRVSLNNGTREKKNIRKFLNRYITAGGTKLVQIAFKIGDLYAVDHNPRKLCPNFIKYNSYKNDLPIHLQ